MAKAKKPTTKSSLKSQVIKAKAADLPAEPTINYSQTETLNQSVSSLSDELIPPPINYSSEPVELPRSRKLSYRFLSVGLALIVVATLLAGGFNLMYAGKVYPGVSANGVYLGGLSKTEAGVALKSHLDDYGRQLIPIGYGDTTVRINPTQLDTKYNSATAIDLAMQYGRQGGLVDQIWGWLRALGGRQTNVMAYSYDYSKLTPYLDQIDADVNRPVANAGFTFGNSGAVITSSIPGTRLDVGRLTLAIEQRLSTASAELVDAPIYSLAPGIDTASLQSARAQADNYLSGPLNLKLNGTTVTTSLGDIAGWIKVVTPSTGYTSSDTDITHYYARPEPVNVQIDTTKLAAYVADLAKKVDQPGQDAALTITDGKATVFRASRDGIALDQPAAVNQIKTVLENSSSQRQLALTVKIKKPEVTEDSLNNLGIKELLSEGYSTFPGSSNDRLTNVRVGAAKYNGVLLKPDAVFSFGALLGDVGPEQGYRPSLVIIGTKEEKQYGGGLCQVSSTAFRAALNAGLPIVERVNHSFAVDFYTQPYGVPGVDATIYYPDVDFKFKNDTGHYILIQTIMQGTTLKFDFYGTKTKSGQIRGPQFISGSLDATQPSHTIFWRDVLDLAGTVIKTDTFNTYYKSSKDFTIVENQFH